MTANTTLRISELDFGSIKENLKNYLKSQNQFADYNFDGSGLNILLDILAYNTHYMAYYLNMVGNEAFLDTAQMRSSVISHAKHLNYLPESMKGAEATVNIKVTPVGLPSEDPSITALTMPRFTQFISEPLQGKNYIFCTTEARHVGKINGSFTYENVILKQGIPVTHSYTVENGNRRYVIPSSNCDIDTVTVSVQESATNNFITVYNLNQDITEITGNSTVFFIEENSDANGTYTVYFGDNVLGKQPSNGNIVLISYLDTNGPYANKVNNFTLMDSIDGYRQNVKVSSIFAASSGAEKETIEQIKYRAPIAYTAQNRSVVKSDYESLIVKDYPNISAISVWPGEEADPPVYGKIFIALKPKDNYTITAAEKERLIDDIIKTRSVMTVFPEIINPEFVYLLFNVDVHYNPNKTNLSENDIAALVREALADYNDDNLQTFKATYRESVVNNYIADLGNFILSSEINLYLQKRIELTTGTSKNYTIDFGTSLYRGELGEALYSYPEITVNDIQGTARAVFFEEVPQSYSGIDIIEILSPGSDYSEPPEVIITGDGFGASAIAKIVNGRVNSIEITNRGTNYTRATINITGGGGNGATARARLQLRYGDIRTYYFKNNGEKVIVNDKAGTIDYDRGVINLTNLVPISVANNAIYDENILTINIKPSKETITQSKNLIFDIDYDDPAARQINMVPEI